MMIGAPLQYDRTTQCGKRCYIAVCCGSGNFVIGSGAGRGMYYKKNYMDVGMAVGGKKKMQREKI